MTDPHVPGSSGGVGDSGGLDPEELRSAGSGVKRAARVRVFPGCEVVGESTPREVLRRIVEEDPLGLEACCEQKLEELAFLVDVERIFHRAAARVAMEAPEYDGVPPLAEWLERSVERALRALLEEDQEAVRRGEMAGEETAAVANLLARTLGIEAPLARDCAVVFNGLTWILRRVFWEVVVRERSVERAAEEVGCSVDAARAYLRYALGQVSKLGEWPEPNPDPGGAVWSDEARRMNHE